jgi:predicted TPR repeat methyltransferase
MPMKPDLESAYALETPEDSIRLYAGWADTYDKDFAARRGYIFAEAVAEEFARHATERDTPVLDVGCGTGLVGVALAGLGDWAVDGVDISPEMLAVARAKGVYGALATGDLTGALDMPDAAYGGFTSAGTFTHGHVGPEALDELVRIARPGALFALGINEAHFRSRGFARALDRFAAAQAITAPGVLRTRIYGDAGEDDDGHALDHALVATFRRL